MENDQELAQYVHSFTASSDRVRHLIVISVVASILAFAAYRNALTGGWWQTRLKSARSAVLNEVWKDPRKRLETCKAAGAQAADLQGLTCQEFENTIDWVTRAGHGKSSLEAHLAELEKLRVSDILKISVPFLGISFDVNDLGAFSAIGLAMISLTLCYAMARQHENLYLSMWKVRRIAESERRYDDGQSQANFLYHALAMAQVFTRPPTLARWRPRGITRLAVRALLFLPIAVQFLIVIHNARTSWILSPRATLLSMTIQLPLLFLIIVCTCISCLYSRAGDLRWKETFFALNPGLRSLKSAPWLEWLKVTRQPRWTFMVDRQGSLYLGDPVDSFEGTRFSIIWGIQPDGWIKRLVNPAAFPAELSALQKLKDYRFQTVQEDSGRMELIRTLPDGASESVTAGSGIVQSRGNATGFLLRRSMVVDEQQVLYAIDGATLLKRTPDGEVTVLGGTPLGRLPRTPWPCLMGLALEKDTLLVADYDYGCVRKISLDGNGLDIRWQSRGRWSPAGVLVHEGNLYVLEHRRPWLGGILPGGFLAPLARIQRIAPEPSRPSVLFEIWA